MRREPGDLVSRLALHRCEKLLVLGIGRTGEHEVLPDHDPVSIARLVELVGLVDPATPDPEQVEVRIHGLADPGPDSIWIRRPGMQAVGYPVGAEAENRPLVDGETKPRIDPVLAEIQTYRPQSDPTSDGVQGSISATKLHTDLVERLISVTAWPPASRLGNLELQSALDSRHRDPARMDRPFGPFDVDDQLEIAVSFSGLIKLQIDLNLDQGRRRIASANERSHGANRRIPPSVHADLARKSE